MTSETLGLTDELGQDISQEELDFSDLFLYNPPDDIPAEDDKGALPHDGNHLCSLGLSHPCDDTSTYTLLSHPCDDTSTYTLLSHPYDDTSTYTLLSHPCDDTSTYTLLSHPYDDTSTYTLLSHPCDDTSTYTLLSHPCDDTSTCNPSVSNQPSSSSHGPATDLLSVNGPRFDSLGLTSRPGVIPAPSPRIEITPSGDSLRSHPLEPSPRSTALGAYREQPCVSPASSNSSTGWSAEAYSPQPSPCVSPIVGGGGAVLFALDLGPSLQDIHTTISSTHSSPGASPRTSITEEIFLLPQHQRTTSPHPHQRSRSVSPHGKRTYDQYCSPNLGGTPVKLRSRSPSPIPSPQDHHGPNLLHHCLRQAQPQAQGSSTSPEVVLSSLTSSMPRPVATKMVRNSEEDFVYGKDCLYGEATEQDGRGRIRAEARPETFFILPTAWPHLHHLTHHGALSSLPLATLPSLEWPLPSQSNQYQLVIQQQPRSHHRAHYETEGSRGAVKTLHGGHPEVQLHGYRGTAPLGLQVFIGTADERVLKPHTFYQAHQITGKMVTTPSLERTLSGTRVLEIPLEPRNHMRAIIDCAGILKLKNADIELRNGETDIGRKNTCVCLVFRVHIPQSGGHFVSLQVASDPVECSQRSAQDVPAVENHDLGRCSVLGGQQMVLTGQNFNSDSKVMFSEKTREGQQIWEAEAAVDRDKSQPSMLFLEVPPYRDPAIYHPVKVNFYVVNGKRKRSQPQHFTYTPLIVPAIKAELVDDYQFSSFSSTDYQSLGLSAKSLYHHLDQDSHVRASSISPTAYHMASLDPGAHGLTSHYLEDQLVYYPPKSSTLSTNPVLYQPANQHPGHPGPTVLSGSPAQRQIAGLQQSHYPTLASHISTTITTGYQSEVTFSQVNASLDACSVPRHQGYIQTVAPLGRSPPSRYTQGQAHGTPGSREQPVGQALTQNGPITDNHDELVPEKVTVKQENINHAYLEDVNDVIRRDMKVHSGERA